MSIGYWLKYFGLAAAMLLMRRSYVSKPVLAVATRLGFIHEGTTRHSGWVNGAWADEAIFGLLAEEFTG